MKTNKVLLVALLFTTVFNACKKDNTEEMELSAPTISNLEIGLNNNEIGVIGQDFHFNADIIAGDKIELVQIKIQQRAGETYEKPWNYEVKWEQYKGSKNTTIHKHFDIPTDAVEGKYDFIITVTDQNSSKLELKNSITIYKAANVPVNPSASIFNLHANGSRFYRNGKFITEGSKLKTGDRITSQVTISNVKGDGKMYILLINKKLNHRPESIDKIDFTKAIVYDVYEHKSWTNSASFTNTPADLTTNTTIRDWPPMTIGSSTLDNNTPTANSINGIKTWETGTYYFGVVYLNTTYKIGYYQYIEVPIEIN